MIAITVTSWPLQITLQGITQTLTTTVTQIHLVKQIFPRHLQRQVRSMLRVYPHIMAQLKGQTKKQQPLRVHNILPMDLHFTIAIISRLHLFRVTL